MAEHERIRVLVVDDHAVVREGLRGFLELQDAWMEVWGDLRLSLDDVVDAGHSRVVVLLRQSGTAAGTHCME